MRRAVMTTVAPSRAAWRAMAAPMPDEAPVTRTILPTSLAMAGR